MKPSAIVRSAAWAAAALSTILAACREADHRPVARPTSASDFASTTTCPRVSSEPVRISGGIFTMGQDAVYAEEGPQRTTQVDGFWIDRHEVTNEQFAAFIAATGYVTVAEKPVDPSVFGVDPAQIPAYMLEPGSAVFTPPQRPSASYADWWRYVPGARWNKPYGPDGPDARADEPTVHLAWEDMQAYAQWKGGRLPTEAEWEYAAAAGTEKSTDQPNASQANSWQGAFPIANSAEDGFTGIAPAGCFAPNAFGLYDMVGNVWEMTSDYFRPGHDPGQKKNPAGPGENAAYDPANPGLATRVVKGGSFLCAPNYCQRYRPESRQGRDPGLGASNVGFRLVYANAPSRQPSTPN